MCRRSVTDKRTVHGYLYSLGSGCSVSKRYRDWLGCALRDSTLGQGSATGTSYFKLKLHVSSLHATASTAGSLQAESQTQHCKHWRRASLHGRLLALALVQEPGSHKHKLFTRTELAVCRSLQRSKQAVGAVLRSQRIRHVLTTGCMAMCLLHA